MEMFAENGSVDRKKLAAVLFASPEKMKIITDVIYPLLTERVITAIDVCRQTGKNGAFELPLLYEAGFADHSGDLFNGYIGIAAQIRYIAAVVFVRKNQPDFQTIGCQCIVHFACAFCKLTGLNTHIAGNTRSFLDNSQNFFKIAAQTRFIVR